MPIVLRNKEHALLSTVLFHMTDVRAALQILQKNRFELKPSEGTAAEGVTQDGKPSYYLSCARSRRSDYFTGSTSGVVLELDGGKLGQRYKGKAVDYWGPQFPTNEMEDRVLSPAPFIPAVPYVKSVSAVLGKHSDRPRLLQLRVLCGKLRIPLYTYESWSDLITGNPASRLTVDWQQMRPAALSPDMAQVALEDKARRTLREYRYGHKTGLLTAYVALYKMPAMLDREAAVKVVVDADWKQLRYVLDRVGNYDADRGLNAEMHNAKSNAYESADRSREHLDELVKILRKERWTTKQFCHAMALKWFIAAR